MNKCSNFSDFSWLFLLYPPSKNLVSVEILITIYINTGKVNTLFNSPLRERDNFIVVLIFISNYC